MADAADKASEVEELHRKVALANRKSEGPVSNGRCYNCGASILGGYRWCDTECREDWEKRRR